MFNLTGAGEGTGAEYGRGRGSGNGAGATAAASIFVRECLIFCARIAAGWFKFGCFLIVLFLI